MTKLTTIAVFLILAAGAWGQSAEFGGFGGVSRLSNENLGVIPPSTTIGLADGWRMGFRITLNNWRMFGHEFGYAYNRTQLKISDGTAAGTSQQGMAIHQGFYNFLVYGVPEGKPVRPFVTGGGHFSNFTPPGTSATQGGGSTKYGINYGGGIKIKVRPNYGIRLDVREYRTGKPFNLQGVSGQLKQLEVSVGFALLL